MKTKMKALVLFLSAVLLVVSTVFVTMAYLTSQTVVVKNTFTVGNVKITLDEAKVTAYGVVDGTTRVTANEYKLIPGHTYVKDPTIHVDANSENCWLFVKVENGLSKIEDVDDEGKKIADQMTALGWAPVAEGSDIYAYNRIVEKSENIPVFAHFKIAGTADVSTYKTADNEDAVIKITAYAIQADGFDTAAEAWNTAGAEEQANTN